MGVAVAVVVTPVIVLKNDECYCGISILWINGMDTEGTLTWRLALECKWPGQKFGDWLDSYVECHVCLH